MRPRRYFAVFRDGQVIRITHGHQEARQLSGRAYKSFKTELAAQEYAAWWNYERRPWFERPPPSTKE